MKKIYIQVDIGDIVYLVFSARRLNGKRNIVFKCKVSRITKDEHNLTYTCKPIKCVNDKTMDVSQYVDTLWFRNSDIDTGHRDTFTYPVFTTKEGCIRWLKS